MAATDAYYDSLFGSEMATPAAGAAGAGGKGLMSKLGGAGVKGIGTQLLGIWLLNKYLQTRHESKLGNIQVEGMRQQAESMTPENLYYQAALPQAQEEESMARQALLTQLSGGVIGPSLAKGERMIGG